MVDLEVRIVRLQPMRVASTWGYGPNPEGIAWDKLLTWAAAQGLLLPARRFFGFNNPNPLPGSTDYGYEQWMTVDVGVGPEGDVRIEDALGGLFAVARCEGVSGLPSTWEQLLHWQQGSQYHRGEQPGLEECLNPELMQEPSPDFEKLRFDLYLPIVG